MSSEYTKPGIDNRGLANFAGTPQLLDPEMPGPKVPGNEVSKVLFTGNSTVGRRSASQWRTVCCQAKGSRLEVWISATATRPIPTMLLR